MGETPFKLTYRVKAMIPIEVKEPSPRVMFQCTNSQALLEEADLANEAREMAHLQEKGIEISDSQSI